MFLYVVYVLHLRFEILKNSASLISYRWSQPWRYQSVEWKNYLEWSPLLASFSWFLSPVDVEAEPVGGVQTFLEEQLCLSARQRTSFIALRQRASVHSVCSPPLLVYTLSTPYLSGNIDYFLVIFFVFFCCWPSSRHSLSTPPNMFGYVDSF